MPIRKTLNRILGNAHDGQGAPGQAHEAVDAPRSYAPPRQTPDGLHGRYAEFTMLGEGMYLNNIELCREHAPRIGCIVECGSWRGGMAAGLADVFPDRPIHLFDSFEGLPDAQEIDGPAAVTWQQATDSPIYYDNCLAERERAEEAMSLSSATQVTIHQGWFSDTVPTFDPGEPIGILRLDGDWYESTMTCLTHLYPRVVQGGVIIIDDYFAWDGCARAVHDYLSSTECPDRIRQYRDDVCYILKQGARQLPAGALDPVAE